MSHIRWLHLSDFHLRTLDKWSQDVVLKSMLADIRTRYSDSESLDYIFITGDLAHSGRAQEYELVEAFITELLVVTKVPREHLMIVPGNHDIDRTREPDAFHGARSMLKKLSEVDRFLSDAERKRTLFRRQGEFRRFANRVCNREIYSESSSNHLVITSAGSIKVAVMLIDSSWLCQGGEVDGHSILVGERQIIDIASQLPSSALCVGLMHHPISWLAPFEHAPVERLLSDYCHLLFRGHVHEDAVDSIQRTKERLNVFTAGASYESRLSNNCYGYGTLNMLDGCGEVSSHRFRNDSKSWVKQEPETWCLIDQPRISAPITVSLPLLKETSCEFPHFLASLLSQEVSEIPVRYDGALMFLNCHAEIAADSPIAKCVKQMRHVIHWRDCWEPIDWKGELVRLTDSYKRAIAEIATDAAIKGELERREINCERLAGATWSSSTAGQPDTVMLAQATELAKAGECETALAILDRAAEQEMLTGEDFVSSVRLRIQIHLSLDEQPEANRFADDLLSVSPQLSDDLLLIALCRVNVGRFSDAEANLRQARKCGAAFDDVKGLAVRIAGQTGDRSLLADLRD